MTSPAPAQFAAQIPPPAMPGMVPVRLPDLPGGARESPGSSSGQSNQDAASAPAGDAVNVAGNATAGLVRRPQEANHQDGFDSENGLLRLTPSIERLPVGLVVSVPVRGFRIRHLLALAPDELIESQWTHGEDIPLSSGDIQLAWTEFEVVDTRLAVRVTRLA